jgi:hypothetical protein
MPKPGEGLWQAPGVRPCTVEAVAIRPPRRNRSLACDVRERHASRRPSFGKAVGDIGGTVAISDPRAAWITSVISMRRSGNERVAGLVPMKWTPIRLRRLLEKRVLAIIFQCHRAAVTGKVTRRAQNAGSTSDPTPGLLSAGRNTRNEVGVRQEPEVAVPEQ